ncbi:MAG: ABC transporter permease subunit [Clostridia bacterium]|nr:ABC transporter permease subunit [Clostridia bacterium]
MKRLFAAELYRFTHNATFKIYCFLSSVFSVLFAYGIYRNAELSEEWFLAQSLLIAVLISLSVGDEMSKCVRKKVVAGYSKTKILLVELIVSNLIVITQYVITLIICLIVNYRLLAHTPFYIVFISFVVFLSIVFSLTTAFITISCLFSKKALSAVVCLVFVFTLYVVSPIVTFSLEEPQYFETMEWNDEKNAMEQMQVENEKYVAEPIRSILLTFNKANPFSQRREYNSIINPYLYDDEAWENAKEAIQNTIGEERLSRELTNSDKEYLNTAYLYLFVPTLLFAITGGVIYKRKEIK